MKANQLPRIHTQRLLSMSTDDVLDLGEGRSITCLDDYRLTFVYREADDEFGDREVPLAFTGDEWVSARWSDRKSQFTCSDLRPEYDGVYAYARRINDLHGVYTYPSAGVLIRRVLDRKADAYRYA